MSKNFFKKIKKEWVYFGIAALVLIFVSSFAAHAAGYNKASVLLKDKKVIADEIDGEIKEYKSELAAIEEEMDKTEQDQSNKQTELDQLNLKYEEVQNIISQKEEVQQELDAIKKQIEAKKNDISALNNQITDKQKELDRISKGITAKSKEPRTLSAGLFIVGKDLPPGRYKIEPVSGFGNYFVNDGGSVNIILGKGDDMFLPEYIYELHEGDKIEATLSVKYTLVE